MSPKGLDNSKNMSYIYNVLYIQPFDCGAVRTFVFTLLPQYCWLLFKNISMSKFHYCYPGFC